MAGVNVPSGTFTGASPKCNVLLTFGHPKDGRKASETMKAVVYYGGTHARYEELPTPSVGPGEALVKVAYAGVCGSDVTIYTGKHKRVKPPVVMGHEVSGEIVELGSPSADLGVGDAVVVEPLVPCGECYVCQSGQYNACRNLRHLGIDVNGMFAEYVRARIERCYRLPEGVSLKDAGLVEPTAVAVHAVRRSRVGLGDAVVVLGGGPIGLLVAQVARVASSMPVHLVEIGDWRLDLARGLGFDPIDPKKVGVVEEVMSRTRGKGADVLIDSAGVAATAGQLPMLTRIHGRVGIVAMPKEPLPVDITALVLREIEVIGCRAYVRRDFETAIAMIAGKEIEVEPVVSHLLPLERWQEALDLAMMGEASMKILLSP